MLRRLKPRRGIAVGCGLLLLVFGCWCGLIARSALAVSAGLDQLQADLAGVDSIDLVQLRPRLATLRADLGTLRSSSAPILVVAPLLGWLPGIGGDVAAAPRLIDAAIDMLDAGEITLAAVEPLWPPERASGQSALAAMARSLEQLSPQLAEARAAVERAAERLESVEVARLSPAVRRQVERVSSTLPLLRSGFDLIDLAPDVLGFDRPRTYIVLMQNADELRPTGGFISAVARVRLVRGEIGELDVRDSYQVDDYLNKPYDSPPQPLLDFMGSELWLFRDANWSPDFPTSARKAAELYTYGLNAPIDGVIGLNQQAVRAIVAALGPITVEPGQPPVETSNLTDYMRAAWSPPPDATDTQAWIASRKDFIGKLMNAILDRLQAAPEELDWMSLGRGLLDALDSRDVTIWIDDPAVAAVLADRGWDGGLEPVSSDYWMLVDANLGFNKANAAVESSVAYTLTLQPDGSADAELAIHYQHTGPRAEGCQHQIAYTLAVSYEALIQACYWDYVRLLVPPVARLRTASRHPVPAAYLVTGRAYDGALRVETESGKTAFGTLFVLERGRSLDVTLAYQVPALVTWTDEGGRYRLTVQKQSGAAPRPVSIMLIWPEGYMLSDASLAALETTGHSARFAFDLSTDRILSVTWK